MTNAGQKIILLVIAFGSAWLLLANLGNQYLWQDEAQTALVSKTILTDGVPRGYDGKNFFSQEGGAEYGKNYLWRWHTWLPFYVVAGFYKVFGINTFTSRLPFALFGFGTVLLTYFLAKALWPGGRVPAIAAALLAVSVPFLLLCRQCRYYSMTMFFSELSLYAYVALLHRKKYSAAMLFAASTLLFHSQHIYVVVFFAVVLMHAVIFHRDRLKILLIVGVITIILNGPWLIWLSGMNVSHPFLKLQHRFILCFYAKVHLENLMKYVFPPWLLAVGVVAVVVRFIKTRSFALKTPGFFEKVTLLVLFIIFTVIAVSTMGLAPFFRYVAPTIPLVILLVAVIIDAAIEAHWLIGAAAVVMLIATSQLKDYFYEITHDYNGPEEGIALYLNEHGLPDDVVAVNYGDMPLKFYTKMRVVGGLTGEDLEPAKNARWVIIRKSDIGTRLSDIDLNRYRRIEINYPDIPYENREDPGEHLFRTNETEDKVVIYERIN